MKPLHFDSHNREESFRDYQNNPNKCPVCQGGEGYDTSIVEHQRVGSMIYVDKVCNNPFCDFEWTENFSLTSLDERKAT